MTHFNICYYLVLWTSNLQQAVNLVTHYKKLTASFIDGKLFTSGSVNTESCQSQLSTTEKLKEEEN